MHSGVRVLFQCTAALIEGSCQIGHRPHVAGSLHLQEVTEPAKSIFGKTEVESGERPWGADSHEPFTNESEAI